MSIFRLERFFLQLLFVILSSYSGYLMAHGDEHVKGVGTSQAEQAGATCVRPVPVMRRNHMELIKHQRDLTVRKGMRETTDSIAKCIACHVRYDEKKQPIAINGEGQFCESCHEELAVELDCFECHSTVPRERTSANQLIGTDAYSNHIETLNVQITDMLSSLVYEKPQEVKD